MQNVEQQTGKAPEDLIGPPMSDLVSHIWHAFVNLNNARPPGFSGPSPITYESIRAWMETTGHVLIGWEVEAVKRLDTAWLQFQKEEYESKDKKNKKKPRQRNQ